MVQGRRVLTEGTHDVQKCLSIKRTLNNGQSVVYVLPSFHNVPVYFKDLALLHFGL